MEFSFQKKESKDDQFPWKMIENFFFFLRNFENIIRSHPLPPLFMFLLQIYDHYLLLFNLI